MAHYSSLRYNGPRHLQHISKRARGRPRELLGKPLPGKQRPHYHCRSSFASPPQQLCMRSCIRWISRIYSTRSSAKAIWLNARSSRADPHRHRLYIHLWARRPSFVGTQWPMEDANCDAWWFLSERERRVVDFLISRFHLERWRLNVLCGRIESGLVCLSEARGIVWITGCVSFYNRMFVFAMSGNFHLDCKYVLLGSIVTSWCELGSWKLMHKTSKLYE